MAFTLNPIKHSALVEFRVFGDCYFVHKILSVSEFIAKYSIYSKILHNITELPSPVFSNVAESTQNSAMQRGVEAINQTKTS